MHRCPDCDDTCHCEDGDTDVLDCLHCEPLTCHCEDGDTDVLDCLHCEPLVDESGERENVWDRYDDMDEDSYYDWDEYYGEPDDDEDDDA